MPTTCMPERVQTQTMWQQDMPAGQETILLAEDEERVRAMLRLTLRVCGYRILEAADGDEAIRVGQHHRERIDLLVTDQNMPRAYGSQVAAKLRSFHPKLRVLYVTGHVSDDLVASCEAPDGDHLLEKPVGLSGLARKVRAVLDDTR
jgi:two-component system cell cycle sensor histidine kinase/response regulator CckA